MTEGNQRLLMKVGEVCNISSKIKGGPYVAFRSPLVMGKDSKSFDNVILDECN